MIRRVKVGDFFCLRRSCANGSAASTVGDPNWGSVAGIPRLDVRMTWRCDASDVSCSICSLKNRGPNQMKSLENWGLWLWRNFWYMFTWKMSWYLICHESWCLKLFDLNWSTSSSISASRCKNSSKIWKNSWQKVTWSQSNPSRSTDPQIRKVVDWTQLSFNVAPPNSEHKTHKNGKMIQGDFMAAVLFFMILHWSFDFPFSCCWLSSVLKSVNVHHMQFCNEVPLIIPFFGDSWQRCQRTPMLCGLLSTHHCQ